jgi:hypothetical protein
VGVALALSILLSLISIPTILPWLMSWMGGYTEMMGQAFRGLEPTFPQFGSIGPVWIALAGAGYAFVTWLYGSLLQTFSLTMYAEVYRRLAGAPAASAVEAPVSPGPAPILGPLVPDDPPAPDEAERPSI